MCSLKVYSILDMYTDHLRNAKCNTLNDDTLYNFYISNFLQGNKVLSCLVSVISVSGLIQQKKERKIFIQKSVSATETEKVKLENCRVIISR